MTKITISEAAKMLSVSRRTFDTIKHRPGFPRPIKYSERKIFYVAEELEKWDISQRS